MRVFNMNAETKFLNVYEKIRLRTLSALKIIWPNIVALKSIWSYMVALKKYLADKVI